MIARTILYMAAGFSLAMPVYAEDLGRLFFTPEQRGALDARRKARIPDKPTAVVVESPVTRIDGVVSRRGGQSTTWVNGEAVPEGSQPEGLRVRPKRNDNSRIVVNIGETESEVDLKIGQSFDRGTGEVRDSLNGGDLRVNRSKPGGGK
ncbi:MAG: hypothetical protein WCO67_25220 [Betaproteobacteria bacterium]